MIADFKIPQTCRGGMHLLIHFRASDDLVSIAAVLSVRHQCEATDNLACSKTGVDLANLCCEISHVFLRWFFTREFHSNVLSRDWDTFIKSTHEWD